MQRLCEAIHDAEAAVAAFKIILEITFTVSFGWEGKGRYGSFH